MKNIAVFTLFIALILPAASAFADERTEPACQNEVNSLDDLMGRLAQPEVLATTSMDAVPGRILKLGPFGDPRFSDGNWEKRYIDHIYHSNTKVPVLGWTSKIRYQTQIHFMFNRVTRQAAQIKFHTSVEQGCVGDEVVPNPKISARAGDKQCKGGSSMLYVPAYERATVYTDIPVPGGGLPTVRIESKLIDKGGNWIRERDDCNGK